MFTVQMLKLWSIRHTLIMFINVYIPSLKISARHTTIIQKIPFVYEQHALKW